MRELILVAALAACLAGCGSVRAEEAEKVPLIPAAPDVLTTRAGDKVDSAEEWRTVRGPEVLEMFRKYVYGRAPVERPADLSFEVTETTPDAMDGAATRKLVAIRFSGPGGEATINLVVFIPNAAKKPVPAFLLICHRDPENIDPTRKVRVPFWPAEHIIERGYATAAFWAGDVDPDNYDEFKNGVHGMFDAKPRPADAWGTICAWAWGGARSMDYLETDPDIDHEHVAVIGHSRGGKTALWCGARDERFALAISNNSGCTGAALARRKQGERLKDINKNFPHWFCENYNAFNDREEEMPVDQHMLIALMAPRLVYVASATLDLWADPKGEFASCVLADPVYRLFGLEGLDAREMPPHSTPLQNGHIGYHLRPGKHDLSVYDWDRYMDFTDKHWKRGAE